jgi:hypothetical protein
VQGAKMVLFAGTNFLITEKNELDLQHKINVMKELEIFSKKSCTKY